MMRKLVVVLILLCGFIIGYLFNEVMDESPSLLAQKELTGSNFQNVKQEVSKLGQGIGKPVVQNVSLADPMIAWLGNNSLDIFH
jgi:hypothetical protein